MQLVVDPSWVVRKVVDVTAISEDRVITVLRELRHVIDGLITDDVTLIAPPLVCVRRGDPVWPRLRERALDPSWTAVSGLQDADEIDIASALDLPVDLVEAFPMRGEAEVLGQLVTRLEIVDDSQFDQVREIVFAWLDTFSITNRGVYLTSRVGRESDFDTWLIENLQVLDGFDYPVQLHHDGQLSKSGRQWRFVQPLICDLLCRVVVDTPRMTAGDWLVIENKATMAEVGVVEQILGYMACVSTDLAANGERVHGLVLSDGLTVEAQRLLTAKGLDYLSLSALGYRDYLFAHRTGTQDEEDFVRLMESMTEPFEFPRDTGG